MDTREGYGDNSQKHDFFKSVLKSHEKVKNKMKSFQKNEKCVKKCVRSVCQIFASERCWKGSADMEKLGKRAKTVTRVGSLKSDYCRDFSSLKSLCDPQKSSKKWVKICFFWRWEVQRKCLGCGASCDCECKSRSIDFCLLVSSNKSVKNSCGEGCW